MPQPVRKGARIHLYIPHSVLTDLDGVAETIAPPGEEINRSLAIRHILREYLKRHPLPKKILAGKS